jgi:hypothetical protein
MDAKSDPRWMPRAAAAGIGLVLAGGLMFLERRRKPRSAVVA